MASVQEQLKLKRAPTDIWSVREQLCLATSVLQSGDQNWMSVSRSLKSQLGEDPSRPAEWFSQKSCAKQYDYLLEKNTDIPRRQKRESGETTNELIKRRLTEDRIAELTKVIEIQKEEYLKLKSEVETLRKDNAANEKYKQMWLAIQEEEKQKAAAKEAALLAAANNIQVKKDALPKNTPSPVQTPRLTSPKLVASKLTSPKTPAIVNKPETSSVVENRPSSSAPTLSMLLQQPSVSSEKMLQKLETSPLKNLPGCSKIQSLPKTKPMRPVQDSESTPNPELASVSQPLAPEPVDQVATAEQVSQVDNEKSIEPVSDLVEIKQEDTGDSKSEDLMLPTESKDNVTKQSLLNNSFDQSEERLFESSFSTSAGDISMEEIDSSSLKIAEIIGTSIEIIEPKVETPSEELEKIDEPTVDPLEDKITESLSSKESSSPVIKDVEKDFECKSVTEAEIPSPKQQSDDLEENVEEIEKSPADTTADDQIISSTAKASKDKLEKEPISDTEKPKEKRKSVTESIPEKSSKDKEAKSETSKSKNDQESDESKRNVQNVPASSSSTHKTSNTDKVENVATKLDSQKVSDTCTVKEVIQDNSSSNVSKKPSVDNETIESVIKVEVQDDEDNKVANESEKCDSAKEKKDSQEVKIKEEIKTEEVVIKQENIESEENSIQSDKEESSMVKFSGGQVVKTYSKKQNARLDSELENDSGEETHDYRTWKKSVLMLHNRISTHKYGSTFTKPITEEQAPGYHDIVKKPMDLSRIKKNIDNGTIRTTNHFQRDVMLMFQNAIMFNKQQTHVFKMTVEMQEDFLQQLEVLHRASGESSFRRETRTAANSSSEILESGIKRRWSHNTSNLQTADTPRLKKLRKSRHDS